MEAVARQLSPVPQSLPDTLRAKGAAGSMGKDKDKKKSKDKGKKRKRDKEGDDLRERAKRHAKAEETVREPSLPPHGACRHPPPSICGRALLRR